MNIASLYNNPRISRVEQFAFITSTTYYEFNAQLRAYAAANLTLAKQTDPNAKPFYMPTTYWGGYVPGHAHADSIIDADRRASALSGDFHSYLARRMPGPRPKPKHQALKQMVDVLNAATQHHNEVWCFTLLPSSAVLQHHFTTNTTYAPVISAITTALTDAGLTKMDYFAALEGLHAEYDY